jgi:hypothetical protein
MTDFPELKYKPGVQLTDQVTFTLTVGNCVAFMHWMMEMDSGHVPRFMNDVLDQIGSAIYDQPSIKAAEAYADSKPKTVEEAIRQQFPNMFAQMGPFLIVCDVCGSRDEYSSLPDGELTCGHDGPRHGIGGMG